MNIVREQRGENNSLIRVTVGEADYGQEVEKSLREYKRKANIPGFRPGKPTSDFIAKVLSKITLFGAIYLGIVAICPLIVGKIIGNSSLAIGGTSVIIVVGVALETVKALEAQMLMRHYKGFLD